MAQEPGQISSNGRKVTITAIAQAAGVSVPTVSRVVNGRSDVAPETRAKVEDLLRQHGYRRRTSAPGDRAALLDLVFNDLDSPWAVEIIRGVEDVAHAAGVGTVVSAIHGRAGSARQWMKNLRDRASDGVILVTSVLEPVLHEELRRLNVPIVVVDPAGSPTLEAPTVGATNWAGGTRPSISSRSATAGSASSRARPGCSARAPDSTATGRRWRARASRSTTP
jgi:LacI family transcriptional regulator